jgi:hypothetical protein
MRRNKSSTEIVANRIQEEQVPAAPNSQPNIELAASNADFKVGRWFFCLATSPASFPLSVLKMNAQLVLGDSRFGQ